MPQDGKHLNDYPDVLTAPQAATLLQMSPSQVYAYCAQGAIPHVRVGRLVRIPKQLLIKWMEEGWVDNGETSETA